MQKHAFHWFSLIDFVHQQKKFFFTSLGQMVQLYKMLLFLYENKIKDF